jgi:hypothetical protein
MGGFGGGHIGGFGDGVHAGGFGGDPMGHVGGTRIGLGDHEVMHGSGLHGRRGRGVFAGGLYDYYGPNCYGYDYRYPTYQWPPYCS